MTTPPDDEHPLTRVALAPRFGDGLCMRRMAALAPLACPDPPPSLKIAGTNGKGSTATLTDFMLGRFGLRTGRFLSPHVLRPNERIAIDGQDVDDDALAAALDFALDLRAEHEAAHPGDRLSAFEIWFLAALTLFNQAQVDVMILEAGIGGRYDPTRWPPSPLGALTSVDRDHIAQLGPTLEHVACDKADAVAEGGTLVVAQLPPDLRGRLDGYLSLRGVTPVHLEDRAAVSARAVAFAGAPALACAFDSPHPKFAQNAGLARLLAEEALARLRAPADARALNLAFTDACAGFRPPGRLRRLRASPELWADIAHTPEAAAGAVAGLSARAPGRKLAALVSLRAERDAPAILGAMLEAAPDLRLVFTVAEAEAADTATLLAVAERLGAVSPQAAPEPAQAVEAACGVAGANGVTLAIGSSAVVRLASAALK